MHADEICCKKQKNNKKNNKLIVIQENNFTNNFYNTIGVDFVKKKKLKNFLNF